MENKYFSLEPKENQRPVEIFQLALGILCIAIAVFWIVFKIKSLDSDHTQWATIVFLVLFGIYEIMSGTGKTRKYIKTGPHGIVLKQHSVLPQIEIISGDIEKIELYSFSIIFYLKNRKKIAMRFGLNYTEIINPVKQEITAFAEFNKIPLEIIKEDL